MEMPKAMIVERIRSRSGPEVANQADEELSDKLDSEEDSGLLEKYGINPEELHGEFGGGTPSVG